MGILNLLFCTKGAIKNDNECSRILHDGGLWVDSRRRPSALNPEGGLDE